eukprot:gnl/TRDRNA2_/TRDRNA2_91815_c0_seq1.p1 gnl/TRDRNA2_/TRDRNA2_91815_c0~~gnl/TRDRNA2_/TRDRNA2_91815_c0_seq1.p1  ORF type:complete len:288 (-),score=35.13 gnl/TRDRNA2_/TRDRNA2_91815_c0_seq1:54-917(-)
MRKLRVVEHVVLFWAMLISGLPSGQGNNFDVVILHSQPARWLFRRIVGEFRCPCKKDDERDCDDNDEVDTDADDDGFDEAENCDTTWLLNKYDMDGYKATEDYNVPVLAMRAGTPCAAAFYLDAFNNHKNSFYLSKLIRNAGDECKGGGAAIMCYLIRGSHSQNLEHRPLTLPALYNRPNLTRYFASFGCKRDQNDEFSMSCTEPHPKICEAHVDAAYDGDSYNFGSRIPTDGWDLQSHDEVTISCVAFICVFAGIGVSSVSFLFFGRMSAQIFPAEHRLGSPLGRV